MAVKRSWYCFIHTFWMKTKQTYIEIWEQEDKEKRYCNFCILYVCFVYWCVPTSVNTLKLLEKRLFYLVLPMFWDRKMCMYAQERDISVHIRRLARKFVQKDHRETETAVKIGAGALIFMPVLHLMQRECRWWTASYMLFLLTHCSVLGELSKDWEATKKKPKNQPQRPNTKIPKKPHK